MGRKNNAQILMQVIGLALYFTMFRFPFLGFFLTDKTPFSSDVHVVIETTLIAFGIALALLAHRFPRMNTKGTCSLSGGIVCALGVIAMGLSSKAHLLPAVALFPAGGLFGIGFLLLSEAWFQSIRTLPSKTLIPIGALAFSVSMVFGLVDQLPTLARTAAYSTMPLLSALCAFATFNADFSRGMLEEYERPSFPEALQIDILAIVFIFSEIVFAAVIRSLWAHQGLGHTSDTSVSLTYAISAALGVLLCVITINSRFAEEAAGAAGGITLLVLIGGAFAYSFEQSTHGASAAITSCYSVLQVVLMCLISLTLRGKRRPYSGSSGIFCALVGFSSALSYSILPRTIGFSGFAPSSATLPTVFLAIGFIILVLAGCFVLILVRSASQFKEWQSATTVKTTAIKTVHNATPRNANPSEDNEKTAPPEKLTDILTEKLQTTYGLTDRETDITILLANGFTARRVSEELYLSLNTVNSYTKTIYRKMDVHKKDELIEKVNAML